MTHTFNSSVSSQAPHGLSDQELLHAVRKRRRTMHALRGFTYEGISADTSQALVSRLGDELQRLEQECTQRGLQVPY